MAQRPRGPRSKTRQKFKKEPGTAGLPGLSRILAEFSVGDRVNVHIEPSYHKGTPAARFHGLTGTIVEKRGKGYIVELYDMKKKKLVIAQAAHLRKAI